MFRESVRIAHLDRPVGAWPAAVTRTPAELMRLAGAGVICPGAAADLVLFRGRHYSELLSRPETRASCCVPAGRSTPRCRDYRELDALAR